MGHFTKDSWSKSACARLRAHTPSTPPRPLWSQKIAFPYQKSIKFLKGFMKDSYVNLLVGILGDFTKDSLSKTVCGKLYKGFLKHICLWQWGESMGQWVNDSMSEWISKSASPPPENNTNSPIIPTSPTNPNHPINSNNVNNPINPNNPIIWLITIILLIRFIQIFPLIPIIPIIHQT